MTEITRRPIKKLTRDELEREFCGLQEYCDNAITGILNSLAIPFNPLEIIECLKI